MNINRRELVKNLALASGAAAIGASWPFGSTTSARAVPKLPNPGNPGIDHLVVVTMENRSFDHFLGWLPNAAFQTVANGPKWANTVFIVNFDEWGGFFEHVAPPRAIAPNNVDPDLVNGKALLGFRVPTIIASLFSAGEVNDPRVSALVFDHTSVLKLIEWRWGLAPLTARDASNDVANLANVLNFERPNAAVPTLPQPAAPLVGALCPSGSGGVVGVSAPTSETTVWSELGQLAAATGFPVNLP